MKVTILSTQQLHTNEHNHIQTHNTGSRYQMKQYKKLDEQKTDTGIIQNVNNYKRNKERNSEGSEKFHENRIGQ